MFNPGKAKGDTKLEYQSPRFCEDFQYVMAMFNHKLDRDAEMHSNKREQK